MDTIVALEVYDAVFKVWGAYTTRAVVSSGLLGLILGLVIGMLIFMSSSSKKGKK